jgi:hypothetical protein
MIKQLLTVIAAVALSQAATAQITVTSADMPVANDTPRHTMVNPTTATLNLSNTGPNITWDYSTLVPVSQTIDTYRTASSVGYTITGNPTGFKIADTLNLGAALPITLTKAYTFFSTTAASYNMTQLAMNAGFNIIVNYTIPDTLVYFPLTYNRKDTSVYKASYSNPLLGSLFIRGVRYAYVDGWGKITTPNSSTPVDVLRLRSESVETDSFALTGQQATTLERHMVTYQWMANGVHTPILMITTDASTTTETPTSVVFYDHYRPGLSVGTTQPAITALTAYPNPSASGVFQIDIPETWKTYTVDVYDMTGKLSVSRTNMSTLDIKALPSGNYIVRVTCGTSTGYVRIAK